LACALVGAALAAPAGADTEAELDSAEQQLADARAELDRVNRLWQDAEAELARSEDAAEAAEARIATLRADLAILRQELNRRAASLFIAGGNPQAIALITSESVTDAADRLEYASAIAQGDADLATRVSVESQELAWQQDRLADAIARQREAVADLEDQQAAIQDEMARFAARVEELEEQLAAEQAPPTRSGGGAGSPTGGTGSSPPVTGSGWLQTCPVNGASSFVDSFGDPRPGGRSHQGIDMIAAQGTPVVAVHSGTVHHTGSSIGGLGVVVFHDGSSDWTFYTHFDSYGSYGEGAHVSAGDTIGYVGNTGTTVYHLHFEYHPGGGAAVDPYSALLGVC
jgi:murein DD-endopeptidase MepM/ murein hydrolase activator NlpD